MSVSCPGFGRPPGAVRLAPWRPRASARTVARMPLYVVPRTGLYQSDEELAAAADCAPALADSLSEDVRWIRSYVVAEEDGTYSTFCVYDATSPEHLLDHADALMMPTDAIKPVVATTVVAPDPEPVRVL